ncbi:hypothetical protein ACFXA2_26250 [Micromonospora chalcea]
MIETPSCCKYRGLWYPDGRQLCYRHITPEQRGLLSDLDNQAAELGILTERSGWPYGPNIDVISRQRLIEWAGELGVSLASTRCQNLHWLQVGRCGVRYCEALPGWADHVTRWKRDGGPAVLVAQPYGLNAHDLADLDQVADDDRLHVEIVDEGWYGHGTTMVEVWNRRAWQSHVR